MWECYEEEGYSTIFAAQDLCLLNYIPFFSKIGIESIKIEGRTKSSIYLAQVLSLYKKALNDFADGCFRPMSYREHLKELTTRDLSTGFFLKNRRTIVKPEKETTSNKVVALVAGYDAESGYTVQVKNKWLCTSDIEVLRPGGDVAAVDCSDYKLFNIKGERIQEANSGTTVILDCPYFGPGLDLFIKEKRQADN